MALPELSGSFSIIALSPLNEQHYVIRHDKCVASRVRIGKNPKSKNKDTGERQMIVKYQPPILFTVIIFDLKTMPAAILKGRPAAASMNFIHRIR